SAAEVAEGRRICRGDAHPLKQQLAGLSLVDRLGEEPVGADEMSALLLNICRVLDGIHQRGLDHLDLTPRNIRVPQDGSVEIEALPARPPNATLMMAEPKYAAPEMLLSHGVTDAAVHVQSDIYV